MSDRPTVFFFFFFLNPRTGQKERVTVRRRSFVGAREREKGQGNGESLTSSLRRLREVKNFGKKYCSRLSSVLSNNDSS